MKEIEFSEFMDVVGDLKVKENVVLIVVDFFELCMVGLMLEVEKNVSMFSFSVLLFIIVMVYMKVVFNVKFFFWNLVVLS